MFVIKYLVIFCIIILFDELHSQPQMDWFDSIRTLFRTHKIHTALIIHSNTPDHSEVQDKLFSKIIKSIPSISFKMGHEHVLLENLHIGALSKLSTSLLFIHQTQYSGDNSQLYRVMHSINKLVDFSVNCYLLLILRTSSNFRKEIEESLQQAWNRSMLNIAIAEFHLAADVHGPTKGTVGLDQLTTFSYGRSGWYDRGNLETNKNLSRMTIHQFNPFINKFYHREVSTDLDLFPNFAKDMNGLRLKVPITHQPPFTFVTFRKNGEVEKMSGPNIILMQTIAEKINATPVFMRDPNMAFWLSNFTVADLIDHSFKWDITAHLCVRFTGHIIEESMRTQIVIRHDLGVLMPVKTHINKDLVNNILESSGLTLTVVLFIWLIAILLKLDRKLWKLNIIFRWILSLTVQHQPSNTFERIFFITVVMIGFMYANNIYATFTHFGMHPIEEKTYKTWEDIDNSGLTPMIRNPIFQRTFVNATGAQLNLKRKTIRIITTANCLQAVLVRRTACCILYKNEANYYIQWSRTRSGKNQLKLAAPIFWSHHATFLFRQSLPGKKNINTVIKRCQEAGLLAKWYSETFRSFGSMAENSTHLGGSFYTQKGQLIVVALLGHSLAALVFIGEWLTHRFKNSFLEKFSKIRKSY